MSHTSTAAANIPSIIPRPTGDRLTSPDSLPLPGTISIVADEAAQLAKTWLQDRLSLLAPSIKLIETNADIVVTLAVDTSSVPAPHVLGVRADGAKVANESYSLMSDAAGIHITAATPEGAFRGATSALHLLASADATGSMPQMSLSHDAPRFHWRGLSLDVVRTFHPPATVRKVIDLLALYKFNVLHLHLTDSEGWRFPVPDWPNLIDVASQTARDDRPGGSYTTDEFADLVSYATNRFITIVPEFDSPGHTASVITAYPDLATPEIQAMSPALQYLHPDQPGVPDLLRDVYTAMSAATPGDRLHIGGDEALAMDESTFHRYLELATGLASDTDKHIVAWQEASRGPIIDGEILQYWIPESLIEKVQTAAADPDNSPFTQHLPDDVRDGFIRTFLLAAEDVKRSVGANAMMLVSRADKLYLDTKYVEPSADPDQASQHERVGLPSMVYGNGTVEDAFTWDAATLNPALPLENIAGIEACIWCETIMNEDDLFFQLLPRLAGVAEHAWNGTTTWDVFKPTLASQSQLWDTHGLPWFRSSVVWTD